MSLSEERFVKIICIALKVCAWFFLIYGIIASITTATMLTTAMLTNRWSGLVLLFFFTFIFLAINLGVKIAEIVLKIKNKIEAV